MFVLRIKSFLKDVTVAVAVMLYLKFSYILQDFTVHFQLKMKNRTSWITFSSKASPAWSFSCDYVSYLSAVQRCIGLTSTCFYLLVVSGRNQWILVTYRKSSCYGSTQEIKTFRKLIMQSGSHGSYLAQSPTNN